MEFQVQSKPRLTGDCVSVLLCACDSARFFDCELCLSLRLTANALLKDTETGSGLCVVETVHRRASLAAPLSNPFNMIRAVLLLTPSRLTRLYLLLRNCCTNSTTDQTRPSPQILLLPLSKQRSSCFSPLCHISLLMPACAAVMGLSSDERCSLFCRQRSVRRHKVRPVCHDSSSRFTCWFV